MKTVVLIVLSSSFLFLGCDDASPGAKCGNGLIDPGETCDPPDSCPTDCNDSDACTVDSMSGSSDSCDADCMHIPISECTDDDGCCSAECNANIDSDCQPECGNGAIEAGETCDPQVICPIDCDDGNACTVDHMSGAVADCDVTCERTAIDACSNDDGCCPAGCDAVSDNDCSQTCDNGVIEEGETCDPPDTCPADCDDGNLCTTDLMTGSVDNCNVACSHTGISDCLADDGCCPAGCDANSDNDCSASCGNDVIEDGETCDPPGTCPADCDDLDACTIDLMTGSPDNCNVDCSYNAVTECLDNDGCCAPGCNGAQDNDCQSECGNDVVEPGETCDPPATCPTDCDDGDFCTIDTLTGSADNCDAECLIEDVTECLDDDGCCPLTCDAVQDNDCDAICGNDVVEPGETCDPPADCPVSCDDLDFCTIDTLTGSADNCDADCLYDDVTDCLDDDGCCPLTCDAVQDNDCDAICGNDVIEPGETCDPVADCPTFCEDLDFCTTDMLSGDPDQCTSECSFDPITDCLDDDGCCPATCDFLLDNDCTPLEICTGGSDEDGDGFTDCADLDCFDDVACAETCPAVTANLSCSDSQAGDTGAAANVLSWYNCLLWDETGGELVYDFTVAQPSQVTVDLTPDPGVDVDIFVLEADCQQDTCMVYGDHQAIFTGMPGVTYYLVVDSYQDQGGAFSIDVSCATIDEDCNNGIDDDFDSQVDCDDNDCNGDPACPGNGQCQAAFSVHCNDTRWSSTTNQNQSPTDVIDGYSCGVWDESGPEVAWEFVAPRDGQVSVSIEYDSGERDLDLFVLENMCRSDQCIHQADESLVFDSTDGSTYYFVIDGRDGDFGSYVLRILCDETCDNFIDDDGDFLADCADPDCHGDAACLDEHCVSGVDEDLDGFTDCDNPDCTTVANNCPADNQCDTANLTIWCEGEFSGSTSAWGSTDVVDIYSCTGDVLAGPEQALVYTAAGAGQATVTVTDDPTGLLKVSVLEDSCDGTSCVGHGDTDASFAVQDGHTYYLVVDGPEGTVGAFSLELDCQFEDCFDMADNDGDDLIDCDDPDCQGTPWCPAGICQQDDTIGCDESVLDSLTGQPNEVMYYPSCMGGMANPGGEMAYLFTTQTPVQVMATMFGGGMSWIMALEGECSGDTCLMMGGAAMMFDAVPGKNYYIVIDGEGDFDLSTTCSPAVEICVNGEDDDQNGDEDCADAACAASQACPLDGRCVPRPQWWSLTCGGEAFGSTAQWGNTDVVDGYVCSAKDAGGPEVVYSFVSDTNTSVTIDLSHSATIDLDLYVLQGDCAADACLTGGSNQVTFPVVKDKTYLVVVDSASGNAGPFTLQTSCAP